eukprot:16304046-Heterocapsa_arctica.AAC.1
MRPKARAMFFLASDSARGAPLLVGCSKASDMDRSQLALATSGRSSHICSNWALQDARITPLVAGECAGG